MKLFFLRHAEAEDGPVDAERKLTPKGRRDAGRVGRYLRDLEVPLDAVFCSPLVRAVETAALVLDTYPIKGVQAQQVKALLNDTTPTQFQRWLERLPDHGAVLLVGHEPSLGEHVRALIGLPDADRLPFPKAALMRVDTEDRRAGALRLVLSPKHLP